MMRGDKQKLIDLLKGKKVAYIATKNADYIRISQEVSLVRNYADKALIITSNKAKYINRLLDVYKSILTTDFRDYDIVFVGFMAQMILPWFKAKFQSTQIIEDFFISIYDTLTNDRQRFSPQSLVGKLVHWIDKLSLKSADIIISDTNTHGKYFRQEFGITRKTFLTLYLEADRSLYYPRLLQKPEQWRDKFLVLYFGSILPVQGVDVVLNAVRRLSDWPQIHFIIIGPIEDKIHKPNTANVTYIDWLSQQELARYIAFSDLCLAGHFSNRVEKANRTIPGKAYIYEAMDKPIVLGDSNGNKELFSQNEQITIVKRGSSSSLAKVILQSREKYES